MKHCVYWEFFGEEPECEKCLYDDCDLYMYDEFEVESGFDCKDDELPF